MHARRRSCARSAPPWSRSPATTTSRCCHRPGSCVPSPVSRRSGGPRRPSTAPTPRRLRAQLGPAVEHQAARLRRRRSRRVAADVLRRRRPARSAWSRSTITSPRALAPGKRTIPATALGLAALADAGAELVLSGPHPPEPARRPREFLVRAEASGEIVRAAAPAARAPAADAPRGGARLPPVRGRTRPRSARSTFAWTQAGLVEIARRSFPRHLPR